MAQSPPQAGAQCPDWCSREHADSDHVEDRIHQSEPRWIPAVVRRSPLFSSDGPGEPAELMAQALRRFDSQQTWVCVREPEGLSALPLLSVATAQRLALALLDLVRAVS